MAEKKKAVIETRTIHEYEMVEYVALQTKMSRGEFYEFMAQVQSATSRADTYCFRKYQAASDRLKEDENDSEAEWNRKHWFEEWQKMSDLNDLFKDWLAEFETWSPDYEEKEGQTDEEN